MKILIPDNVKNLMHCLDLHGYEAFVVGGCVRDSLLGMTPHDWDICTNARPEQIKRCFKDYNTFDSGIKHGTVSVVQNKEVFEITTYRIDGEYLDNRHPESVTFTDEISMDLARRDFTVNAMAYNEQKGLVDPFGGQQDLKNGIIKCVGIPDNRFGEDSLRILRALRFASVFSFTLEAETSASILKNAELLNNIAAERISVELCKLLCGASVYEILKKYRDVIAVIIPELKPTFDYDQHTKHHNRDLWDHTAYAVKSIDNDPILRMTMLLHDIGKPKACKRDDDGTCHYKIHPRYSAQMADVILRRLKFSANFIETCTTLIQYHDVRFNGSKRQLRHVMSAIGEDNVKNLLKVQRADIMSQSEYKHGEKLAKIEAACISYDEIIKEKDCFTLKQLKINGNDLIAMGISDGITIGKILKRLLSLVMEDKLDNSVEALKAMAETIKKSV